MDIWIAIQPNNAEKIVTVLKEFGFNVPELKPELFLKEDQIIRMGLPPIQIEISTSILNI